MSFTKSYTPVIPCEWSEWARGDCSVECGAGAQNKRRSKTLEEKDGGTCVGETTEIEDCMDKECPGS